MSAEQTPDIADVLAEYLCPKGHGDGWFSMTTDAEGNTKSEGEHRWPCGQHQVQADILAGALAPVLAAAVREAERRAWERGREDMRRQSVAVMTEGPQPVLRNPYRADCIEVHWGDVDSRPTSLHGNGAKALGRVTLDVAKVTCRLCLALLSDRADRITEPVSHEAATSGEEASKA